MVIAVGGENLIDFVQEDEGRIPPAYVAHPGGSPMNVAMACSRQGAQAHYMTPVSTDSMGDLIAARLEADGVILATPRRSEPTSLAVVSLTDGAASYQFYRDGTAERQVTPESLAMALPDTAQAFHIGSLAVSGGEDAPVWEAFHGYCKDQGLMTSYDPNVRPTLTPDREGFIARVERMATKTDILKLSDEDLHWMYPDMTHLDAFERFVALSGAPLVVVTKGAEGAMATAGGFTVDIPAAPVQPLIDTVGAGDTFMATLVRQMVDRKGDFAFDTAGLRKLIEVSSQAAAINCTRAGCQPPSLEELTASIG